MNRPLPSAASTGRGPTAAAAPPTTNTSARNTRLLTRQTHQCGGRTMVGRRCVPEAPNDVVVELLTIGRQFTIDALAVAVLSGLANRLAAAIAVGDHIRTAIVRVHASSNPGDRRGLGPRGTGVHTAAAAAAEHAVDRAIGPEIT